MLIQSIGHAIVHRAAFVRLGMQYQRCGRVGCFGRHVAALKTTFRSVDNHLGHRRIRSLVILWKRLIS